MSYKPYFAFLLVVGVVSGQNATTPVTASTTTTSTTTYNIYKVKLFKDSINRPLCSTITSNVSLGARSKIECSTFCNNFDLCSDFNFNSVLRICQMYSYNQTSYSVLRGCFGYKVYGLSGCRPVKNPLPQDGCGIPYTYSGNWYINCTFLSFDGCPGFCLTENKTIGNCDPDINYGKNFVNQTYNISSKIMNLMSINKWILIQQRLDITVSFDFNFPTYEAGFGDQKNFWIGLTTIYQITKNQNYKIRFEMRSANQKWYSAEYSFFYMDPPASKYILRLGTYSGDAGDGMRMAPPSGNLVGYPFQTYETTSPDCQKYTYGGWWTNYCGLVHMNDRSDLAVWGSLPNPLLVITRIYVKAFA